MTNDEIDEDHLSDDEKSLLGEEIVPMVARAAVVLSPRQPWRDWVAKVPPGRKDTKPNVGGWVFLVPIEIVDEREVRDWLKQDCSDLFAQVLSEWTADRAAWPSTVDSWPLFTAWFDLRFVPAVYDLDDGSVDDDAEDLGDDGDDAAGPR